MSFSQLGDVSKLIGSYFNMLLYGVELLATYCYFASERYHRDVRFVVWVVIISVIVDTIGSFASCANVFVFLLSGYDTNEKSIKEHWTVVIFLLSNALTEVTVQSFMVYRYYRLSSNRIATGFILLLMLLSLIANSLLGGMSADSDLRLAYNEQIIPSVLSLSSTVAADVSIACVLTYKLLSTRTFNRHTKHLVRRLCASAILTGSATSLVATATLLAFLVSPAGELAYAFSFFLGRTYTLTMLFTLLTRDKISGNNFNNPLTTLDINQVTLPIPATDPQTTSHIQTSHARTISSPHMTFTRMPSLCHPHSPPYTRSLPSPDSGAGLLSRTPSTGSIYIHSCLK